MKKCFVLAAVLVLSLTGCVTVSAPASAPAQSGASTQSSAPVQSSAPAQSSAPSLGGVPQFVNDAYKNASEDVLVGVGTYKIGNDASKMSAGKTYAETRARADLSRQLQTIIKNMIIDYQANSELDPKAALSFQEEITQALSRADLKGAKIIEMQTDSGILWLVMEYSKSAAANDYSAAQAAAKLAVPAAAAFDALSRMDNQFDKLAGGGPVPVGD
jgi:hypothetical protein